MKRDPLKIQSHVILGILILQYLLGMAANLFVQYPDTNKEKILWEFAKSQWTVVTHMVLGFLLLIGGIVLLFRESAGKIKIGLLRAVSGYLQSFLQSVQEWNLSRHSKMRIPISWRQRSSSRFWHTDGGFIRLKSKIFIFSPKLQVDFVSPVVFFPGFPGA